MKTCVLMVIMVCLALPVTWAGTTSSTDKGKEAFEMNGCTGCHTIGKDWNGPDISNVTTYRSKEWLIDFVLNTKKHYEDPVVRAMIEKFNLYMPDQGVEPKDAELIYEYLKSLEKPGKKK